MQSISLQAVLHAAAAATSNPAHELEHLVAVGNPNEDFEVRSHQQLTFLVDSEGACVNHVITSVHVLTVGPPQVQLAVSSQALKTRA